MKTVRFVFAAVVLGTLSMLGGCAAPTAEDEVDSNEGEVRDRTLISTVAFDDAMRTQPAIDTATQMIGAPFGKPITLRNAGRRTHQVRFSNPQNSNPSSNAAKVFTLAPGASVRFIGDTPGWDMIYIDGVFAYYYNVDKAAPASTCRWSLDGTCLPRPVVTPLPGGG